MDRRRLQPVVRGAGACRGQSRGPVLGGLLLKEFSWPSVFVALVPVALVAAAAVFLAVPESRDPDAPPVDRPGMLTASVAVGSLVYTIIEAPSRGWASTPTFVGFTITILSGIALVLIERDSAHPMLDVSLFPERAFSAASGSVTVAFLTVGRLYRGIKDGLSKLTHDLGERALFVGSPRAQATPEPFHWPQVVAVTDLDSALQAVGEIIEQGRGCPRALGERALRPLSRDLGRVPRAP